MIAAPPLWDFSDLVEPHRRQLMLAVVDWAAVRCAVESYWPSWSMPSQSSLEIRRDRLHVEGIGARRASVRIGMPSDHVDIIYNSPVGLRAQYCLGKGPECNRELINVLTPACLAGFNGVDRELAGMSLLGVYAKICLNKVDIPNLQETHIIYDPWIKRLDQDERLAVTGVLAPKVEAIWIKGGWILDGVEWEDPSKADRDDKFCRYGFA